MNVAELPLAELARRLVGSGLRLRTGAVVTQIRSSIAAVRDGIALLYAEHPVEPDEGFADFRVRIALRGGPRRWIKRQVSFQFEGTAPFHPLPAAQAYPVLEWGLNWCVSANCHQYLILHAAVLERAGRALLLPAPPGSGKSTLAAGLAARGWRLLSDELALIDPGTSSLVSLARPISLKNASIEAVQRFAPGAVMGAVVHDTLKGSVAHMKPPSESTRRAPERALPAWIVLPRYEAQAPRRLERLPKGRAFMHLADNAFNYHLHGRKGFELLVGLVERCACYELSYGELAQAVEQCERLAA